VRIPGEGINGGRICGGGGVVFGLPFPGCVGTGGSCVGINCSGGVVLGLLFPGGGRIGVTIGLRIDVTTGGSCTGSEIPRLSFPGGVGVVGGCVGTTCGGGVLSG